MKKMIIILLIFICFNIYSVENKEYGYLKFNIDYNYKHKIEIFKFSDDEYKKSSYYREKNMIKLLTGTYRFFYYIDNEVAYNEFELLENEIKDIELKFIQLEDFKKNFNGFITISSDPDESGDILVNNKKIGKSGERINISAGIHKVFFRNKKNVAAKEIVVFPGDEIKQVLSLVTKKDLNKYLFQKHYYYESAAFTGRFFYFLGVILPPTNLLFMSYYANFIILSGFALLPFVLVPIVSVSFSCSVVGWVLFGYQGYKYFIEPDGLYNLNFFIGAAVCLGVSYLINLVIGIFGFAITGGFYVDRYDLKSKYRYIRELMLEIDKDEINLSYGFKF